MKKASRTTGTTASMTTSTRMERDTMGELPVPSNAYYGVQTARAIESRSAEAGAPAGGR